MSYSNSKRFSFLINDVLYHPNFLGCSLMSLRSYRKVTQAQKRIDTTYQIFGMQITQFWLQAKCKIYRICWTAWLKDVILWYGSQERDVEENVSLKTKSGCRVWVQSESFRLEQVRSFTCDRWQHPTFYLKKHNPSRNGQNCSQWHAKQCLHSQETV